MTIEISKFWMVLAENSAETRYRHESKLAAVREAERLAEQNAGTKFFVLGAEGYAIKKRPVDYIDMDEIPF